jgi:hypothetical protein
MILDSLLQFDPLGTVIGGTLVDLNCPFSPPVKVHATSVLATTQHSSS